MSLKETLLNDMKEALKTKDTLRKDTVQIIRAGVLQIEKDSGVQADDAAVIDVISKELKKRYDVLPDYERSGREESIAEVKRQIEIMKSYLPAQLSNAEILEIVDAAVKEAGAVSPKDMGKVMQIVTPKVKGRADTKAVSETVKAALGKL